MRQTDRFDQKKTFYKN